LVYSRKRNGINFRQLIDQGCDFTIIRLHIGIPGTNSLLNIELNENSRMKRQFLNENFRLRHFIACIGLLGLPLFATAQRKRNLYKKSIDWLIANVTMC
jgi:hypothetical protein